MAPKPVTGTDQHAFIDHLDRLIPRCLARYGIPGSTVALVSDGSVVWSQGYGLANRARSIPMVPETILQVASISKSVAAWGVMRLVEQNRLDLDKSVENYLSRWHLSSHGYDPTGVTVRRLLCHSAGLNDPDFPGHSPNERLPNLEESLSGQAGTKKAVTIIRQPGTHFVYSDADYAVLQLVIEEITAADFALFMQREVLNPLGMTDSSFEWSPGLEKRMAISYDPQGRPLPRYRYTEKAANGLHTTATDLARFLAAWTQGPQGEPAGRNVLSSATIEHMLNERVEIPGFEGWVYAESYGLGCFIETASNGKAILSHMGGYLGWRSTIALIPDMGEGIIILSNSDLGHELFAYVLNAWSNWLGIGQLQVAHAITTGRKAIGLAAGGVALCCLAYFFWKAMELKTHQRQLSLGSGRPLSHRRRLTALVTLAGLPLFRRFAWPALQANMPSTTTWGGIAALALELAALTAILTEKKEKCDGEDHGFAPLDKARS